jgi:hypothetical protein
MKYLYLVPEELRNAKKVSDALADVAQMSKSNTSYLVWNFFIFTIGCIIGFFAESVVDEGLVNAIITFDGVIIGFVITAMLFSGRSQFLSHMNYEQTKIYAARTKYMLMSQINTLFAFLVCLVFSLLSMLAMKNSVMLDKSVLISALAGYFLLGCYRMVLLPFQIYDIHSLALDNLVHDSSLELKAKTKAASEERLKLLSKKV